MIEPASPPPRITGTIAAVAITAALAFTVLAIRPAVAWAAGNANQAGAPSAADLQVQAQELAGQIQADGRILDELDASYNAAEIRYQNLTGQQVSLWRGMAATSRLVEAARQELKAQAVLAYLAGGAPIISYVPSRPGSDPSLTTAYAEIVAGGQKQAVQSYRSILAVQSTQAAELVAATRQASVTLKALKADQSSAAATLASQQQTLSQVKGQMAVLVADVQAAQVVAETAAVKSSLVNQGQSLPPTAPVASTPATRQAPTTAPPPGSVPSSRPAPTSHPTTTSPATAPPATSPPTTKAPTPTTVPASQGPNLPAPGANIALNYARAQLGKPYQWGGAGPSSFDCSGLVMMAWAQAGVYFPHLAQDQYNMTRRIPLADLLPGDMVFYGTPSNVYHVGIYIGGGDMIDAPETGQNVSISTIYWTGLLGAGRVQS